MLQLKLSGSELASITSLNVVLLLTDEFIYQSKLNHVIKVPGTVLSFNSNEIRIDSFELVYNQPENAGVEIKSF